MTDEEITFVFGDDTVYRKAIKHLTTRHDLAHDFHPLTATQVAHVLAMGLLRTDIEIEAFDCMERGVAARVRYMADEIVRMA